MKTWNSGEIRPPRFRLVWRLVVVPGITHLNQDRVFNQLTRKCTQESLSRYSLKRQAQRQLKTLRVDSRTLFPIDRVSAVVLGCCFATQFFKSNSRASGAPNQIGENREAGEIPARSRHCDALEAVRLPGH